MTVKTEALGVNKKYVKVLLNKFLHTKHSRTTIESFAGEEDTLNINERKGAEEEE